MPIQIVRADITKMKVDAIVNAANETLLGGGGVDGAIHNAAGPRLLEECRKLGGCRTGEAKITKGYKLPCRYVIHTVGPIWQGGECGERELLESCYKSSLMLAVKYRCKTVAFPLISSGVYGYPKDRALCVAIDTISAFLLDNDEMTVYVVIFDKASYTIGEKLFSDIKSYIDDRYADEHYNASSVRMRQYDIMRDSQFNIENINVKRDKKANTQSFADPMPTMAAQSVPLAKPLSLDEAVKQLDESFSEMLLRKIDERGMTDAQCYKKANIDRKLFSKIRSDKHYRPSKTTAIAFAIALELPLDETRDMLMKAGYALSHSSKFDIIIEYFIERGNYNIFEINEALFAFDQSLLGA